MSAKEILYVSYRDEALAEGVSYAIYLAGALHEGLRVVLINDADKKKGFEDSMAAAAFAEANEHGAAREIISGGDEAATAKAQSYIFERCRNEGIKVTVHSGHETTAGAVRNVINRKKIDLVLLSPLVSHTRKLLKKLMRLSPRPVVTMAEAPGHHESIKGGSIS